MPTIQDLKIRLATLQDEVQKRLPEIAQKLTLTAKALAERRIKEMGFGVAYSSNKYPAYFLYGKELNQAGRDYLAAHGVVKKKYGTTAKQKKTTGKGKNERALTPEEKLGNWSEFREAQGLQTDHVDLSYTNKMFANMGCISVEKVGEIVKGILGGTNTEAQNKMNWNFNRYGDFIGKALTEADRQILDEFVIAEIMAIVEQINL